MGIADQLDGLRKRVQGGQNPAEDERLLQLYWNRVELKKEFSRLQEDNYSLLQQLKKQETAHGQMRERLQQLEEFLGNPENGAAVLVFYQLQALWSLASKRLAELRQELVNQQTERERRLQTIEFDQNRQRRLAELEKAILDTQSQADALDARVQILLRKLEALRWFWHYGQRRELNELLAPLQVELTQVNAQLVSLQQQRDELASAAIPDFSGLTVEGKRLVNTAIVAYAQQLLERLGGEGLAMLAKDASFKRVMDVDYGSVADCQAWMTKLQAALKTLQENPRDLSHLKQVTQRVRSNAFYRSDHDTVPVPETIGTVLVRTLANAGRSAQPGVQEEINVLLDDYWELYSVLLH
ncbi:MAG: hypothetical protein AB7T07_03455 [Steroidobacteraceae bacterium]